MKLDHIALIISSEVHLSFYEKLGFRVMNRIERSYDAVVFMKNDDVTLEIFIDPNHPKRASGPETLGLRHVAFAVEDLTAITEALPCEQIRTDWFGRKFTFVRDPDGQLIEIEEWVRGANGDDEFASKHKEEIGK